MGSNTPYFLKRARARSPIVGLFLALFYIVWRYFSRLYQNGLLAEALTDDLHEPRAEVGVSDACQGQGHFRFSIILFFP